MNSPKDPSFFSQNLQTAFDNAKEIFNNYEKQFDQISEDIKALESYLRDKNIRKAVSHQVYFEVELGGQGGSRYSRDAFLSSSSDGLREKLSGTPGAMHTYSLVWGEAPWPGEKKRYRLQYEHTEVKGELKVDDQGLPYVDNAKARETDRLPLIESPLEIRLMMRDFLPEFVSYLAEKLK